MSALVSSVRVRVLGAHAHVEVWSRGGSSGKLVVDRDDAASIVARLLDAPLDDIAQRLTSGPFDDGNGVGITTAALDGAL